MPTHSTDVTKLLTPTERAKQAKVVYLSGPMTGIEEYNYPAFNQLERDIKALNPNVTVINPTQTGVQLDFTWQDYLRHDLIDMLQANPDLIVTLPEWEQSRGAKLEVHVANQLGVMQVSSKWYIEVLRGNKFERPTVIYRKSDFSVFSIGEFDLQVGSLEHFEYEHEHSEYKDEPYPLALAELPLDVSFDNLGGEVLKKLIEDGTAVKYQPTLTQGV